MNIGFEKMLFYNDLAEYTCSEEGKKLDYAFSHEKDMKKLEELINDYYTKRNSDPVSLTYASEKELEDAKDLDKYIARLYCEQN